MINFLINRAATREEYFKTTQMTSHFIDVKLDLVTAFDLHHFTYSNYALQTFVFKPYLTYMYDITNLLRTMIPCMKYVEVNGTGCGIYTKFVLGDSVFTSPNMNMRITICTIEC